MIKVKQANITGAFQVGQPITIDFKKGLRVQLKKAEDETARRMGIAPSSIYAIPSQTIGAAFRFSKDKKALHEIVGEINSEAAKSRDVFISAVCSAIWKNNDASKIGNATSIMAKVGGAPLDVLALLGEDDIFAIKNEMSEASLKGDWHETRNF